MTYHTQHARKAMTAIAAVLAFSTTPLLAQETSTPPPVADPAPEATPPAADPLAPEPAPAETATTATKSTAAPAKAKATTTARRSTTRTVARSEAPAPAAEAAAPVPPPAAEPATTTVAPGPMPVADPAPATEPASNAAAIDMDEALPIAGGAALGLILLAGVAAVRRRRRHKQEDADEAAKLAFIDAAQHEHQAEVSEPAFVRASAPRHDPVPARTPVADAPVTELPEDFDLSRFGPHVQAAYRGPTEDNPSLSLKHRLRRASFLDQQERRVAEKAGAKPAPAMAAVTAKPSWETRPDGEFIFRRAGNKPAEKPALQDH